MKVTRNIALVALAGVATAVPALTPASAAEPAASAAAVRQFEGTVVSVDRARRTFRLRDSERGTVRIKVTSRTRFERINGFAGLRRGMRNVESTVKRSNRQWVATEVEISGGGGRHGGRGSDDD